LAKFKQSKYMSGNLKESFFVETKKKRPYIPIIIILLVLALLVVFATTGLRKGQTLVLTTVTVPSEQLPESFDGFRILQISDILGKEFGANQSKIRELLKDAEYDIVIFTGDFFQKDDEDPDFWLIRDLMSCLDSEVPVYYILGDNDYSPPVVSTTSDKWKMCIEPPQKTAFQEFFETEFNAKFIYPVQQVRNSVGDAIYLTGIEYDRDKLNNMDFDQDVDFSICVTHKPINYNVTRRLKDVNKRMLTEVDYDLTISGHTLGGQYRIPILGNVFSEDDGWFPQEEDVKGLSISDGRYQFINGGLGVESGFRFFSNPEICIIELQYVQPEED